MLSSEFFLCGWLFGSWFAVVRNKVSNSKEAKRAGSSKNDAGPVDLLDERRAAGRSSIGHT
jgi:hypothetical protein